MSSSPQPRPHVVGLRLSLLVAGCLAVAAVPGAPAPPPPVAPVGNEVEGWSLRLRMTPAPPGGNPASLQLAVLNHAKRARGLTDITVCGREGRPVAVDDQLRLPVSGISYVLRFRGGPVVVVRHWSGFSKAAGTPQELPLAVPAAGEVSGDFNPAGALFGWSREARDAARAGKPYCVTAVVETMGLRSNAVLVGEPFRLPKGYDPLEDVKEYRRLEAGSR